MKHYEKKQGLPRWGKPSQAAASPYLLGVLAAELRQRCLFYKNLKNEVVYQVCTKNIAYRLLYCPGGTKRRMHLTDLSGRKTYFPIVVACLDGFGRLGGSGKIIRIDMRRVFSMHIDKNSGKPPNSFFDFLTLVIRHRFFFFVTETLNPIIIF